MCDRLFLFFPSAPHVIPKNICLIFICFILNDLLREKQLYVC
jgi:hypothetical protein